MMPESMGSKETLTYKRMYPGDRIGDLTVLYDTGERKYRCVVWRCSCELCGREVEFISRDLFQRGIRDCGCRTDIRRSLGKIGPGDRLGELTVPADPGERKASEIIWICRCQCGYEVLANTGFSHYGKVTDRGCVSSRNRDLMGRRFGDLTVIGEGGDEHKDGRSCMVSPVRLWE